MLKKLAKYGNSTTLVIDKAILELLNMDESSIVKLQTDGKSLIITPMSSIQEKICYDPMQAMGTAIKASVEKKHPSRELPAVLMSEMKADFAKIFEKHAAAMSVFSQNLSNQEFQDALALLAQKYDPVVQSEDYMKEFMVLRAQFFPDVAAFDKDISAIGEKYKDL